MSQSATNLLFFLRKHFGTAGMIGIALLVLTAACVWIFKPQVDARVLQLAAQLQVEKSDTSKDSQRQLAAPSTVLQLRKFFEWLPPVSTNSADIQTLFSLAKDVKIDLAKADYQVVSDPNARLIRYQIILPVKERYPTIRKFSSSVLAKLPHVALDEFVVTRPLAASNVIEAQLQLTLFYRVQ
jgi:hypothetical protein